MRRSEELELEDCVRFKLWKLLSACDEVEENERELVEIKGEEDFTSLLIEFYLRYSLQFWRHTDNVRTPNF